MSPKTKRVVQTQNNVESAKSNTKKMTKNGKSLVIAREIKFAKLLAGNDKKVRDKVLKNLRKWLTIRSESTFGKNPSNQICKDTDTALLICGFTFPRISIHEC